MMSDEIGLLVSIRSSGHGMVWPLVGIVTELR
jgi:hypothetical protein